MPWVTSSKRKSKLLTSALTSVPVAANATADTNDAGEEWQSVEHVRGAALESVAKLAASSQVEAPSA